MNRGTLSLSRKIAGLTQLSCVLLGIVLLPSSPVRCQTEALPRFLTVRLLNAKSGKPVAKRYITIKWDKEFLSAKSFTNSDGLAHFEIPTDAKVFVLLAGPKSVKEPYRIAYSSCNDRATNVISVADVLEKGVVPQNTCGKKTSVSRPWEAVFWALPLPPGKPDFQ